MPSVLIAEDNLALANVYRFCLSKAGFSVVLAKNGSSAVEHASKQRFDLIILDHQMPKLTGVEALEIIREKTLNRQSPAMFCTAKINEKDWPDLSKRLQISEIVKKPFSPVELMEMAVDLTKDFAAAS